MAVVQLRNPTEGRAPFDRRKADGKTSMEAMRCVKRRLSDLVYKTMLDHLVATQRTGPGGQQDNDSDPIATGSQPDAGSSDKSLPGPAKNQPKAVLPAAS
jgi:transposase